MTLPPYPSARRRADLTPEAKYRLLLDVSRTLGGTLELDELLLRLLDTIGAILPYDAAGVFVLNRHDLFPRPPGLPNQLIAGMATRGFEQRPPGHDPMLVSGRGIIGHVIKTGEVVVAPNVADNPYYIEGRAQTRSEIAVPVLLHGVTLGALNLESDAPAMFDARDVETLRFFADAAALSIEKAMLHRQLLDKRRMENQLQIAHDVQARLLPARAPVVRGYDIAGMSLPTYDVGGDYFDYVPLPDHRLGLVVADVAGKGIPAALIMATFRALLRTHARRDADAADVVTAVNELLIESVGLPAFVTAVYGVLDPATGAFSYANCGHNPPLLVRRDGRVDELAAGGPFLGVFGHVRYQAGTVTMERGDRLVLFTDGVIEARNAAEEDFGVDRLCLALQQHRHLGAEAVTEQLLHATRDFTGTAGLQDDFTLLVVRRDR
jgi:sigma-B regulation protein RsbU (phosphoserine phosphatase)